MKKLLINLLLAIISLPLTLVFGIVAFIYTHIKMVAWLIRFGPGKVIKELSNYYWLIGLSVDQTANAICQYWFNDWMLKDSKDYPFGHPDQTVSHVIGINYGLGNQRFIGRIIGRFLNFLDKNHMQKAADNEQYSNTYKERTE